jgi:hypothetical protein
VQIKMRREQAITALNQAAQTTITDLYKVGDQVWLEARNLALPYPTAKLAPRRHGPFPITKRVSAVAYQLALPRTWTIHEHQQKGKKTYHNLKNLHSLFLK